MFSKLLTESWYLIEEKIKFNFIEIEQRNKLMEQFKISKPYYGNFSLFVL